MPLEIKKTVQQMVDEANSQIETMSLEEAAIRANCGATALSPAPSM